MAKKQGRSAFENLHLEKKERRAIRVLNTDSQDERRKYDRYETSLKIQFYVNFDLETKINFRIKKNENQEFSKEKYPALSKNVSVEGLCFMAEKKLKKGDMLLLDVYVPSASHPIKMQGEVRWCKEGKIRKTKEMYETGVKVISVNDESVEKTIFLDDIHQIAWSVVLESVFGSFKHLTLKRKRIQ